jgi:hypothetical protein
MKIEKIAGPPLHAAEVGYLLDAHFNAVALPN